MDPAARAVVIVPKATPEARHAQQGIVDRIARMLEGNASYHGTLVGVEKNYTTSDGHHGVLQGNRRVRHRRPVVHRSAHIQRGRVHARDADQHPLYLVVG
jgi:hypothetical protein